MTSARYFVHTERKFAGGIAFVRLDEDGIAYGVWPDGRDARRSIYLEQCERFVSYGAWAEITAEKACDLLDPPAALMGRVVPGLKTPPYVPRTPMDHAW